jgi:hypothetical protein
MAGWRMPIAIVTSGALLLLAGCGNDSGGSATSTAPEIHRIKGALTLRGTYGKDFFDLDDPDPSPVLIGRPDDWNPKGNNCTGHGGYEDIKAGLQVTIRNEAGTVIGTGDFGGGTVLSFDACEFHFAIPNVPKATFYQIEAGRRGTLRYSYAEMQSKNWKVAFALDEGPSS